MTLAEKIAGEMVIIRGGPTAQPRVVIYGEEKTGKTSTAAQAKNPLFIGTDDGRRRLNVDGLALPTTWGEAIAQLRWAAEEAPKAGYKTLVLDTLNGLVDLCAEHVCQTHFGGDWHDQRKGFFAWGGNQGWAAVSEEMKEVLTLLDRANDAGMWIVILAHTVTGKVHSPTEGDYDRWQPAVDKRVWARIGQWADVIARVDQTKTIKEENGRKVARGDGSTVLRCSANPSEVAGCRVGFELPDVIPFTWADIEDRLGGGGGTAAELTALWDSMEESEQKKATAFLGTPDLNKAPIHKMKQLINRLKERTNG